MDTFRQVSTPESIFILLHFICATCFTHFNINWTTRKILLTVLITNHLIVQTPRVLFYLKPLSQT
jgi:hypothetical protein